MATKKRQVRSKKVIVVPKEELSSRIATLKMTVRMFYDLQSLRIQSGNRTGNQDAPAVLSEKDKEILAMMSDKTQELEKLFLKEINKLLKGIPVYENFLKDIKGIGPTLAGVIISEIDIARAPTISSLWRWCGLSVVDGKADRLRKGEKASYNPRLKAKLLKVMGDCMIKANSPYRSFYDNYKTRKQNTIVDICMACNGTGKVAPRKKPTDKGPKPGSDCKNCKGTGRNAPWGASDAHRHNAALRVMVKAFLRDLYVQWRTMENLPVTEDYATAKLGMRHGDHAAIPFPALATRSNASG